jgi:apolipoprotein N-acyltransferase
MKKIFKLIIIFLSGLLTAISFNYSNLSFLVWFSLVPIFFCCSGNQKTGRLFYLAGVVHYFVLINWLSHVSILGFFLLTLYLALFWGIFGYLWRFFSANRYNFIILPALWVIIEFIRENIPGVGFGWGILGYSQFENIFLVQPADLFGAKFISFLIISVNFLIFKLLKQRRLMRLEILYGLGLGLFVIIYSFSVLGDKPETKNISVSIVQPNVPQQIKWNDSLRPKIVDLLGSLTDETNPDSLVIYPESSWPFIIPQSDAAQIKEFARNFKRNMLIGAVTKNNDKYYNQALLLDKEGNLIDNYRKLKLVPFGEYVPLRRLLCFIPVFNKIGDISAGQEYTVFNYKDTKFAVLICFEDIFPMLVNRFARKVDFLINITNDAWFGGNPQARQHLSVMVFRAIENRIPIIRSANTGISGYVDSTGEIHRLTRDSKDLFVTAVANYRLSIQQRSSFFAQGNLLFLSFCFLTVFAGVLINARNS